MLFFFNSFFVLCVFDLPLFSINRPCDNNFINKTRNRQTKKHKNRERNQMKKACHAMCVLVGFFHCERGATARSTHTHTQCHQLKLGGFYFGFMSLSICMRCDGDVSTFESTNRTFPLFVPTRLVLNIYILIECAAYGINDWWFCRVAHARRVEYLWTNWRALRLDFFLIDLPELHIYLNFGKTIDNKDTSGGICSGKYRHF